MQYPLMKICLSTLLLSAFGCGDSDNDRNLGGSPSQLNRADLAKFYDRSPKLSDDGSKVIFLSERVIDEDAIPTAKLYLWQSGSELLRLDTKVAGTESASVVAADISGDGVWAALAYVSEAEDAGLNYSLWLVSVNTETTIEITLPSLADVRALEFVDGGNALSIDWTSSDGESFVSLFPYDATSGAVSAATSTGAGEGQTKSLKVGDATYILTEKVQANEASIDLNLYTFDGATLSGPVTISEASVDDSFFSGLTSEGPITYIPLSTIKKKKQQGDLTNLETGEPIDAFIQMNHEFKAYGFTGIEIETSDFLNSETGYPALEAFQVFGTRAVGDVTLVLGGDYYVCQNGTHFGAGFTLVNHATNASINFLVATESPESGGNPLPTSLVTDACAVIQPGLLITSLFENRITSFDVSTTDNQTFALTFESWDSGDPEIYHTTFTISDFSSSANALTSFVSGETFTAVSSNPFTFE